MTPDVTSNPIGQFRFRQLDEAAVQEPGPEVAEKQDPDQTEADFMRDLDKATQRQAKA
jgi:hypothetical protein